MILDFIKWGFICFLVDDYNSVLLSHNGKDVEKENFEEAAKLKLFVLQFQLEVASKE